MTCAPGANPVSVRSEHLSLKRKYFLHTVHGLIFPSLGERKAPPGKAVARNGILVAEAGDSGLSRRALAGTSATFCGGPRRGGDGWRGGGEPGRGDCGEYRDWGHWRPGLFQPVFYNVPPGAAHFRLGVFGHSGLGTVLSLGFDPDLFGGDLQATARAFWLALPGALLFAAAGAWFSARRSLKPVRDLAAKMGSLSLRHLDDRIDPSGADREFGGITDSYNGMLERLERNYQQATRFSGDASHELKTPLAVMRATIEHALGRCADGSREQESYAALLDQIDGVQEIIAALLLLSRADAGHLALSMEQIDLSEWLEPLLEDGSYLAEERGVKFHQETAAPATVWADPVLLFRALHNLLRSAVDYNISSGEVWCRSAVEDGTVILTITNTGPPIPLEERERIFERFARGSNSTLSSGRKGLGIGLSLAREIILAHGGQLTLGLLEPGKTSFRVRLQVVIGA